MNIVFMGTPIFGRLVLEKLCEKHNILAVVCPLDKPNKRGNKIEFCEVKKLALSQGIKVLQYEKVNQYAGEIRALEPDIIITASFGQIISKELLEMCPYGTLNVHGSILPLLRGASPVPQSIMQGFSTTGVSIMRMTERMDEGDVLITREVEIGDTETASELMVRLGTIGGEALNDALDILINGKANFASQDHNKATYCYKITKEDAKIDFSQDANMVKCQINGLSMEPGAYFEYNGDKIKILRAKVSNLTGKAGEILEATPKKGLIIGCKTGSIEALELQSPGGKKLMVKDFLNGKKFEKGTILND